MTGWKRRSSAESFSMCLRNSLSVVAPMHCSSPRASAGLMMFEASIAPSAAPAPTSVCSSSMKRMISPAAPRISSITRFMRSSNSPRYFVPATRPGEVERDHALVAQRLGDLALDDALGQALGDGGLADAGLADERRVVLRAAAEDLDDALDLVGPADDRVELVLARQRGEVAAVGVERGGLRLALGRGGLALGAEQRRGLDAHLGGVDAQVREHARGDAFTLADEAEQQMLRADVVVVELARLFEGELDHALGARREDHLLLDGLAAPADDGLDFLTDFRQVDTERLEDLGREALALGDDAEQDVLGPDVVVTEPLRFFLSQDDAAPRAFGERFPH